MIKSSIAQLNAEMLTLKKIENLKAVQRVFMLTLGLNLLVALSELIWGYYTHTLSLTADGFHSLLDASSNVIGVTAIALSMQPADKEHPYGHRKFEAVASILISGFIFMTCFHIAGEGLHRLLGQSTETPRISAISYIIKAAGLIINICVAWYENRQGKLLKNELLKADAKHTFSDILVSLSVIVSMIGMQLGLSWLDPLLAFMIAVIILKVGYDIILVHLGPLVDEAALSPAEVRRVVLSVPEVKDCHKIRSRGMPDQVFIDLHIQVDPNLTVKEAHQISYKVESALENAFDGQVSEVLVHIEEYEGLE